MSENENKHAKAQKVERTTVPSSAQFQQFISSDWGGTASTAQRMDVADYLPARHTAISAQFPHTCCVIPAGPYKTRSNDTTYRFRAHSAFSHMTGLGEEKEPDASLSSLLRAIPIKPSSTSAHSPHEPPKNSIKTLSTGNFGSVRAPASAICRQ